MRTIWFFLALAAAFPGVPSSRAGELFRFIIKVPANTPARSRLYITGNHPGLCSWKPACLPLKEIGPRTYAAEISLETSPAEVRFKITRGSWKNEASDAQGKPLPERKIPLGRSQNQAVLSVINWVDLPPLGVTGTLKVFRQVYSLELDNFRNISVWLPPDYGFNPRRRYPVIYMHDGQNLFDPRTSNTGVDWGVDESMTALITRGQVPPAIVVGLDSTKDRSEEYDYLQRGDLYARFLIQTVKPRIDQLFRTLPDRKNTFTMGSSMGGLISLALVWKHPEIFSQAGAVSLPVFIYDFAAFRLIDSSPRPALPIRIYVDHGTFGGDAGYEQHTRPFIQKLRGLGFGQNELQYQVFRFADHSEVDWARRVDTPLHWMLTAPGPWGP